MTLQLASHYGMCFGVRDALLATHAAASARPVTMLGQLVHNPLVDAQLRSLGVQKGELEDTRSARTHDVVISAHGSSNRAREAWAAAGHRVTDTTCPLVKKAHAALASLVAEGYQPVVIGQAQHVEVRGLVGDFTSAVVVLCAADIAMIPASAHIGVISQTTQPLTHVLGLVEQIKRQQPTAEVRFIDTVCRPTKQRQTALEQLCAQCDVVVVVGGRNSNNTRQLTETASRLGVRAHQVESPADVDPTWFTASDAVGVTAGTSTLDETVQAVMNHLATLQA